MKIKAHIKEYEVEVGYDFQWIRELKMDDKTFLVIDKQVYSLYYELFKKFNEQQIYLVEAIEENKTIDTALDICESIMKLNAKRNTKLISVGGGIIQDITGFVANILYRGIHWSFVPTTLLAACDSCIGGKTSLNYKRYKNLLGTFFPPDHIYIYPQFFMTLSERDFKSGLGEVIKFNIMCGMDQLDRVKKDLPGLLMRDGQLINQYVESSLKLKKSFIEEDEFDTGKRVLLNFAHTFGHAIETVTKYRIPHGTAVGIGMVMANYVSYERGYISGEQKEKMEEVLACIIRGNVLGDEFCTESVLKVIKNDKKQKGDGMTVVLFSDKELNLKVYDDFQIQELEDVITYIKQFLRLEDKR